MSIVIYHVIRSKVWFIYKNRTNGMFYDQMIPFKETPSREFLSIRFVMHPKMVKISH